MKETSLGVSFHHSLIILETHKFLLTCLSIIVSKVSQIDFFLVLELFAFYSIFRRLMAPNLFTIIF